MLREEISGFEFEFTQTVVAFIGIPGRKTVESIIEADAVNPEVFKKHTIRITLNVPAISRELKGNPREKSVFEKKLEQLLPNKAYEVSVRYKSSAKTVHGLPTTLKKKIENGLGVIRVDISAQRIISQPQGVRLVKEVDRLIQGMIKS